MEGAPCFVLTPAEAGLPAEGAGANVDQYALRPSANARGTLLVFLNGSGGSPRAGAGTSAGSWYGVARAEGLHVVGLSFVSGSSIASLCGSRDACFEPTRASLLTGEFQAGADDALIDLTPDEGIFERLAITLRALARLDPAGGWDAFLDRARLPDAEAAIRWDRVMVSGHSQGGGHAALIGKRQIVAKVIMLAAPCDAVGSTVATWLDGRQPYRTQPSTRFVGFSAPDDRTCPTAVAAWATLGLPASAGRSDASGCSNQSAHDAPLKCEENATAWRALLRAP